MFFFKTVWFKYLYIHVVLSIWWRTHGSLNRNKQTKKQATKQVDKITIYETRLG